MTKRRIPEGSGGMSGAVDTGGRPVGAQRMEAVTDKFSCRRSPAEPADRSGADREAALEALSCVRSSAGPAEGNAAAVRVGTVARPERGSETGISDEMVVSTGPDASLPAGLFVEPPMSETEAARWITKEELAEAAAFGAGRRSEWLSWRALVRRELGKDVGIAYNDAGAPVVTNRDVHIGVSHCAGRIAVLFSDTRCAVDIEPENRNFLRAASRYLAPEERALSSDELLPGVVWCAKEALYKYVGRTELDLLRDIRIREVDLAAGRLTGCVTGDEPLGLTLLRRDGYILVFVS